MRNLVLIGLMLMASGVAAAQNQQCVCTAGCKIAVWNPGWPASGQNTPSSCTVYKSGALIGQGAAVPGSALNNSSVCMPPDATTTPATTMCIVQIPAQNAGNVTLTATATNAAGESPQSSPFVFVSVASLPVALPAPNQLRVTQ